MAFRVLLLLDAILKDLIMPNNWHGWGLPFTYLYMRFGLAG